MIKFITILTKFIVLTVIAILASSCNFNSNINSIRGNGNITTEKRTAEKDFKSIDVSYGIDVIVEQSENKSITVEADSNLQQYIKTEIENGVLVITSNQSYNSSKTPKITVKMPVIEALQASSGSTIESANTLKGENITLNTSSAAEINVSIEADNISLDSSSGSNIIASGKALKLETSASSGSEINAKKLLVNNVISDVSSGASTNIHPIVSLKAEASSGGDINYDIIPKSIQKSISSGGSIDNN